LALQPVVSAVWPGTRGSRAFVFTLRFRARALASGFRMDARSGKDASAGAFTARLVAFVIHTVMQERQVA
jgi:hypothetical protein